MKEQVDSLITAIKSANSHEVEEILDQNNIEKLENQYSEKFKSTPLMSAISLEEKGVLNKGKKNEISLWGEKKKIIEYLINKGADLTSETVGNKSALVFSLEKKQHDTAFRIILPELEKDPNKITLSDINALHEGGYDPKAMELFVLYDSVQKTNDESINLAVSIIEKLNKRDDHSPDDEENKIRSNDAIVKEMEKRQDTQNQTTETPTLSGVLKSLIQIWASKEEPTEETNQNNESSQDDRFLSENDMEEYFSPTEETEETEDFNRNYNITAMPGNEEELNESNHSSFSDSSYSSDSENEENISILNQIGEGKTQSNLFAKLLNFITYFSANKEEQQYSKMVSETRDEDDSMNHSDFSKLEVTGSQEPGNNNTPSPNDDISSIPETGVTDTNSTTSESGRPGAVRNPPYEVNVQVARNTNSLLYVKTFASIVNNNPELRSAFQELLDSLPVSNEENNNLYKSYSNSYELTNLESYEGGKENAIQKMVSSAAKEFQLAPITIAGGSLENQKEAIQSAIDSGFTNITVKPEKGYTQDPYYQELLEKTEILKSFKGHEDILKEIKSILDNTSASTDIENSIFNNNTNIKSITPKEKLNEVIEDFINENQPQKSTFPPP